MLGGLHHDLEDLSKKVMAGLFVEQVAHGIDEHTTRLSPRQRLVDFVKVHGEVEAALVTGIPHRL
jgi:hypothetical protein